MSPGGMQVLAGAALGAVQDAALLLVALPLPGLSPLYGLAAALAIAGAALAERWIDRPARRWASGERATKPTAAIQVGSA